MIFLRANTELKHTFERLIQTVNAPVKWNHIFVVLNNFLILPGEVRSLIFNFDNRKVNTNVIEIPIVEEAIQPIEENVPLTNVLDMILYAFGKWGTLSGIRVDKDYAQLNQLFIGILRELKIEPGYRNDNFRFYQKGIQITYEDVIQAAIESGKKEDIEEEAEEEEKLGLWHNMRWTISRASFVKEEITSEEQKSERIGNNFYMIGYQCPECEENLHMVVYPVDKEFPIETEEGKVYLARAYTCNQCNRFYTPRPGKLLSEGDIYILDFEDDRSAYEDYQELLGRQGEKTSNYKFNEYEWERKKGKKAEEDTSQTDELEEDTEKFPEEELEKLAEDGLHELNQEALEHLEDKLESGFYAPEKVKEYRQLKEKVSRKKKVLQKKQVDEKWTEETVGASGNETEDTGKNGTESCDEENRISARNSRDVEESAEVFGRNNRGVKECGEIAGGNEKGTEKTASMQEEENAARDTERMEREADKVREKYNARRKVMDRMSNRQLQELRDNVRKEKLLTDTEKKEYIDAVEECIGKNQEKELQKRAEAARKGNYVQLCRNIEEIERSDCPKEKKESVLASLYELRKQKAQAEADELMANMPAVMDRKRYQLFREKLRQYKEADITPYEEKLEARREQAERQEIENLVKRAGKSDRGALFRVWQCLQTPDFSKENTKKPLEELYQRIQKLDEEAIDKICPDIMGMTFDEGQEAYEKIASGMFLPEIKSNTLEMIDKRLTKIKSDESELLAKKLQDELKGAVRDASSIHYNQARKAMMGEWQGEEAALVNGAVNTYAADHGRYEYPIVVCDSSRKGTGREGFLLTPEHLFYNTAFSSECIPISQIKKVSVSTGLLNKGIYIIQKNEEKTKIPTGISSKEWGGFVHVLGEFIKYLQEKPESRKVSYLAKEEHEVKCCYRCGYVYKGGDVCPKCGNRANK